MSASGCGCAMKIFIALQLSACRMRICISDSTQPNNGLRVCLGVCVCVCVCEAGECGWGHTFHVMCTLCIPPVFIYTLPACWLLGMVHVTGCSALLLCAWPARALQGVLHTTGLLQEALSTGNEQEAKELHSWEGRRLETRALAGSTGAHTWRWRRGLRVSRGLGMDTTYMYEIAPGMC